MSKLTWHFQQLGTAVDAIAAASGAQYIKVMDPPANNPFPGKQVIGRTYLADGESNALVAQGAAGADAWFARFLPIYQSRSYVAWWEGPNEPQDIYNQALRAALVAFTLRLTERLHSIGKKCVALNLSVGAPDIIEFMDFKSLAGRVDAIGLHEYGAPSMTAGAGWYCLRYRKYRAAWATAGLAWPATFITETGIDGGVLNPPRPRTGWKSYASRDAYMAQLAWYDSELQHDPEVLAATIFTSGPDYVWTDFDFDADMARRLAAHIGAGAPVIPPEASVDVKLGSYVDDFNLQIIPFEQRPDAAQWTSGPYYRIKQVFTTRDGSWEPSSNLGSIDQWAVDAWWSGAKWKGAGGTNNFFIMVLDKAGKPIVGKGVYWWPKGTDPANATDTKVTWNDGTENLPVWNYYDPSKGETGWWSGATVGRSDVLAGVDLPYKNHISTFVVLQETDAEPEPEYDTLAESVRGEAERNDVLRVNPAAALCKAGAAAGLWPTSNEYQWTFGGVSYTGQRFRNPTNDAVTVFYCVTGDWGKVLRQNW